jgi:hypothetical protein
MNKKVVLFSVFAGLMVFTTVRAADIVSPSKDNSSVSIGSAETHRNLYTGGSNVTVNGNTQGDLVAAGGMVNVEGNVQQEALLAGGTLSVNGSVGGHARIVGGNITVSGAIGGDLVIAGGNVNITGKSSVAGDLLAAGGNLIIDAPVAGMARIAGGNITINNKISGDVYVQASQGLVFGPGADVSGTVYYKGPKSAVVQPGAKVGNIEFTELQRGKNGRNTAGILTVTFLIQLLAWLATAFVLWGLFRGFVPRVAEETFHRPWAGLGLGLLGLIVVPIVIVLLFLTIIGYYLAIVLALIYALALALAGILSAIALGYLVLRWLSKPMDRIVPWQAILIGIVVWSLLRLIPVVGWIAIALIFLMVLGTLMRMARKVFDR